MHTSCIYIAFHAQRVPAVTPLNGHSDNKVSRDWADMAQSSQPRALAQGPGHQRHSDLHAAEVCQGSSTCNQVTRGKPL